MLIGGLEAGGTKMVCVIGDECGNVFERVMIPTQSPNITMPKLIEFFREKSIQALGIGCFGPVDLNRKSSTYGMILETTKAEWRNTKIVKEFQDALGVPIGFDTDVNAAAYGETILGAGKEQDVVLYVTVGTGIGVGVCIGKEPLHGMIHPEGGHILLNKNENDPLTGVCPFHENCAEGLASGPAQNKRLELLPFEDAWEIEAEYIAKAITNYIMMYSPNKVILWGGVMHQTHLYERIWAKVFRYLNGYLVHKNVTESGLRDYIVPPRLGENAGVVGALLLGRREYEKMN